MGEQIKKKFLLYFRLMLLVWIIIANAILHVIDFQYSWLIFISNIMLFTMEEGTVNDRFITVELGGLVGLVLTALTLLAVTALTSVLGSLFGFLIPLDCAVHFDCPAPLCTEGFEQRGFCISDLRLYRHHCLRDPYPPVFRNLYRRLSDF